MEAFVNELTADEQVQTRLASGTPQTISRKSKALFKTSKRHRHDKVLTELLSMMTLLHAHAQTFSLEHEKLQSSLIFLQHELAAQKQSIDAYHGVTHVMTNEQALAAVTETTESIPFQQSIRQRHSRFGVVKHYKQKKHSQIILVCAQEVKNLIALLKADMEANDHYIRQIDSTRVALQSLH